MGIYPTKDGCEIQVTDTGWWIPEEDIRKLTEAFYRGHKSRSRAQGGAGLGLSLCNKIVRIHRGEMSFHIQDRQLEGKREHTGDAPLIWSFQTVKGGPIGSGSDRPVTA